MISVEHLDWDEDKEIVFRKKGNGNLTAGELKTIINQLPDEFKDAEVVLHESVYDGKVRTVRFQNKKIQPQPGELDFDSRRYQIQIVGTVFRRGGVTTDAYTLES